MDVKASALLYILAKHPVLLVNNDGETGTLIGIVNNNILINIKGTVKNIPLTWLGINYRFLLLSFKSIKEEIFYEGNLIKPIETLGNEIYKKMEFQNKLGGNMIGSVNFKKIRYLIDLHFDIFNLIDKGFAIDKNEYNAI